MSEFAVLRARLAAIEAQLLPHANQWGPCPVRYATPEEKLAARRRTWRESNRRRRLLESPKAAS